jgi:hypothetical protein
VTKYLRKLIQKEEMFILPLGFRVFSPWLLASLLLAWVRQYLIVETHGRRNMLTSWWPGSTKKETGSNVPYLLWGTPSDPTSLLSASYLIGTNYPQ